jgi:kexin
MTLTAATPPTPICADVEVALAIAGVVAFPGAAEACRIARPQPPLTEVELARNANEGLVRNADAIAVAGCAITQIEWVELRLTAPHTYSGDLQLRLTSPNGLVSRLADARACDGGCGSYADWRFGSARHLGEPADGSWTLEVADMIPDDTGTLQNWSITLHGR